MHTEYAYVHSVKLGSICRLQSLRDNYVPALQRKADSLEADLTHGSQRLEELQAEYALLEHELQVRLDKLLLFAPSCTWLAFLGNACSAD